MTSQKYEIYVAISTVVNDLLLNVLGTEVSFSVFDSATKGLQTEYGSSNPIAKLLSSLACLNIKPCITPTGYNMVALDSPSFSELPDHANFMCTPFQYNIHASNGVSFLPLVESGDVEMLVHDLRWLKHGTNKGKRTPALVQTKFLTEIAPDRSSRLYVDIPVILPDQLALTYFRLSMTVFKNMMNLIAESKSGPQFLKLERDHQGGFKTNMKFDPGLDVSYHSQETIIPSCLDEHNLKIKRTRTWLEETASPSYMFTFRRVLDHLVTID
jgi:hypothetical protein